MQWNTVVSTNVARKYFKEFGKKVDPFHAGHIITGNFRQCLKEKTEFKSIYHRPLGNGQILRRG